MLPLSLTTRRDRPLAVTPGNIRHLVDDMTVIVAADLTLANLQDELGRAGQWLPVDGPAAATLAHLVSLNSTGPLRLGYGAWRDLLLGIQFHTPRGELISAGGQTVKNVAGYDLTKMLIGQAGAFGQIATLTVRTYRKPAAALLATWSWQERDGQALPTRLRALLASPLRPAWVLLTTDELLCGYLADGPAIAFFEQALADAHPARIERRSVEADIADRASRWDWPAAGPAARLTVPPARVIDLMQAVGAAVADPVHGILLVPGRSCGDVASFDMQGLFWDGERASPLNLRPVEAAMIERLKQAVSQPHA